MVPFLLRDSPKADGFPGKKLASVGRLVGGHKLIVSGAQGSLVGGSEHIVLAEDCRGVWR